MNRDFCRITGKNLISQKLNHNKGVHAISENHLKSQERTVKICLGNLPTIRKLPDKNLCLKWK